MKPIHLNLAARPFRDYRPVYAAVVAISLLTAFLMLNNIEMMGAPVRVSPSESSGIAAATVVPPLKVRDFNFTSLSDAV